MLEAMLEGVLAHLAFLCISLAWPERAGSPTQWKLGTQGHALPSWRFGLLYPRCLD